MIVSIPSFVRGLRWTSSTRRWTLTWFGALLVASSTACGGAQSTKEGARAAAPREALASMAKGVAEKDPQQALGHFERAVKADPDFWEARYNLGVLLAERGELERAEKELKRALELAPAAEDVAVALAEVQRRNGDPKAAVDVLEAFVHVHGEALTARTALVGVLREIGATDKAIEHAREVLVRRPEDSRALSELAMAHLDRGEVDAAELLVQQALNAEQRTAAAERTAGLVALRRGEDALAFRHFERAAQLDPKDGTALLNTGTVLLQAGVFDRAEAAFRAVLRNDAGDVDALLGLAAALRGRSTRDDSAPGREAERLLLDVLEAHPAHAGAALSLGILYLRNLDRPQEAKQYLERAKKYASSKDETHLRASQLLEELR